MDANWINIGLTVAGLIIANYGVKFGRIYPLIKQAYELVKLREEAKKDGNLTQAEKAELYDEIVKLLKEIQAVLKGLFPNKSK